MKNFSILVLLVLSFSANAQEINKSTDSKFLIKIIDSINKSNELKTKKTILATLDSVNKSKEKLVLAKPNQEHWYDKFSIRGYVQTRYNGLFSTNDKVSCEQCDRSWGTTDVSPDAVSNNGFFIRRARMIFSGQIHPNLFFYFQPDFANSPSTGVNNFAQIRDAYFDISFDTKREYRVRIGQSKIPYGFENMQSSQNRLSMDRADAIVSAIPNERDLGVFFYWAPEKIRERFAMLVKDGYKGSGDFGVFAFGAYNGQGVNRTEGNRNLHVVARVSYPFAIGNQIFEPGIQAYTGKWAFTNELSTGVTTDNKQNTTDQRVGANFVLYPKPFGIQAEYNLGKGPRYDKFTNTVETSSLDGGYITLNYKLDYKKQVFYPFSKFQYFNGGKKFEKDARSYVVREYEMGIEWQPFRAFELTAAWVISDRTFEDSVLKNNRQQGNLLRIQAQLNF